MRLARQKFKKIHVKLAGINPNRDKVEANTARKSESAEKETEETQDPGTPAERLQKLLDQIQEVKQRKDFKLKKVNLKAQPKITGTALRLMQEREAQRNKFYGHLQSQSQDRLLLASREMPGAK